MSDLGYSKQAPCDISWFQSELDRATRDRAIRLRISWPAALPAKRMTIRGGDVTFMRYPDPVQAYKRIVHGNFIMRGGLKIGYQMDSGVITGSPDGIYIPDAEQIQRALPFFIIEQEMNKDAARRQHQEAREIGLQNGVDIGSFPDDGYWTWFEDLSTHDSECCQAAWKASSDRHEQRRDKELGDTGIDIGPFPIDAKVDCRGVYREPTYQDVLNVKESLWRRAQQAQHRAPDERPSERELALAAKQSTAQVAEYETRRMSDITKELGEDIATCLRPSVSPSVYVDLKELKKGIANVGTANP